MRHIRYTRRTDDRKSAQQLVLSIAGIISLLFIFFFVGIPFLIKFSSFIAGFKKETVVQNNETGVVLEPFLDPLPEATFSARISISGNATSGDSVILYVNKEKISEKIVGKDGVFSFNNVPLDKGKNEIYSVSKSGNKESQPSEKYTIIMESEPPKLTIESPSDGSVFKRENRDIEIRGQTDEDAGISLNQRFVFVNPNGSFTTTYRLNDGENKLEFISTDQAGNTETVILTITYQP